MPASKSTTAVVMSLPKHGEQGPQLSRRLMLVLALLVFSTAGTIHFQTPLLGQIGAEFQAGPDATGWIATLTFAGFFVGTLFLVPLGDRVDKRRLIIGQTIGLIVSLLAMAAAPSLVLAAAASFLIGVCCGLSQHVVPLVTELAPPDERGRIVGTMLSGVFTGLLFARVMSGQVAEHLDWRWTYVLGAALVAIIGVAVVIVLPDVPPKSRLSYFELLKSLGQLFVRERRIRHPAAVQFFLGLCYGGFWATVASMLLALHGLGPAATGLIGLSGAAGILVARPAGRWMDRSGVAPVVSAAIVGVVAAYLTLGFAQASVVFVVLGAALLDCGLRASIVANQTLATSAVPDARSRSMTIFTAHMWGGNAVGALIASAAFTQWGWLGVCAIGISASSTALILARMTNRPAGAHR
ncbi:MAG: MFS transporter [Betaproteobacteria bacterium]